jgi:glycine cleavage system H protein
VIAGEDFGEIESVKATSGLFCAVSGEVIAVNEALADKPELVNSDPFGQGWMLKIKCTDLAPLGKLMDAAAYEKMIAG